MSTWCGGSWTKVSTTLSRRWSQLVSSGSVSVTDIRSSPGATRSPWPSSTGTGEKIESVYLTSLFIQTTGLWHPDHWAHKQVWGIWAWEQVLCQPWLRDRSLLCSWGRDYSQLHLDGHSEQHCGHIRVPAHRWRGQGGQDRIQEELRWFKNYCDFSDDYLFMWFFVSSLIWILFYVLQKDGSSKWIH